MATRSARDKQKQNELHTAILMEMLQQPENKHCADCEGKGPRWASWNLGVFLCIRCSGIHRSLGVHISKVRSVNLDTWAPEWIESMKQWGNKRAAEFWEYHLPANYVRPTSNNGAMEQFIREKYERARYKRRASDPPISAAPAAAPAAVEAESRKAKEKREKKKERSRAKESSNGGGFANFAAFENTAVKVSAPPTQAAAPAPASSSGDLLGDLFGSAPSAQPSAQAQAPAQAPAAAQAPAPAAASRSTTDDIMSLFGPSSSTPAQPQQQNFGMQMHQQPQQQMGFGMNMGNAGMMPMQGGMQGGMGMNMGGMGGMGGMQQPGGFNQMGMGNGMGGMGSMQQGMAGMNLGNTMQQPAQSSGSTIQGNLWK